MVSSETRRLILSFVGAVRAKRIRVEKIVLYGSHALENPRDDSDIDLAITWIPLGLIRK